MIGSLPVMAMSRLMLLALSLALVSITTCASQKSSLDASLVLSWLPSDTETILVANGPFWMSNFRTDQNYQNHEIASVELEKAFEGLTLGLFNSKDDLVEKHLERKKILLAVEGSRHFRSPAGLGELPFEGCELAVFAENIDDRRDAFLQDAAKFGLQVEEIEGAKVVEFTEHRESDIWTIFVAFPQQRVAAVATSRSYLQEVLARMRGTGGVRALPDSLPEWKFVDKSARFWGLRHYDRRESDEDPTSPFRGRRTANLPDEQAIGLIYRCDPDKERKASLTYLSIAKEEAMKIEQGRFPSVTEPEANAGLHIQYRELEPGVIQSTFDLSHSEPLALFIFVFMGAFGHAVYI